MSENTKVTNNVITNFSLDKYESLLKDNQSLNKIIDTLKENVAGLKAQIKVLEDKPVENEKALIKTITLDRWGEKTVSNEYKNISNLEEEALKDAEKEVEKELKELRSNKNKLERKIENLNHTQLLDRDANIRQQEIFKNDLQNKFSKDLKDKSRKIEELKEEIEKVKSDKTDAQLAEKRAEEIAKLKVQVKNLTKQLDSLTKRPWWKRILGIGQDLDDAMEEASKEAAEYETIKQSVINREHKTYDPYRWFRSF